RLSNKSDRLDKADWKNRSVPERFMFALHGLGAAWLREGSFRLETLCAALALVLLAYLRPPLVWWAVGVLIIALVLAAELINSAIEALADHLHPDLHAEIRAVKDMAAGGILVLNGAALAILLLLLAATLF
ncbi:MAG TPA: diacylglycerol kinase, partial [Stellaceae bacterium]|nr:diacylglycerol kinase [Stellaceae bacterium]